VTNGLLLDSNLLCLLVVGRTAADVNKHPRLRAFDQTDFQKLLAVLERFADVVLCPHVLTETSNLLAYRQSERQAADWFDSLADVVRQASERSVAALATIDDVAYRRLGLTDAILLSLAADKRLALLTDDLFLHHEALRRNLRSVNFSYLRTGVMSPADFGP
jgi:hypothetical protein